MIFIIMLLLGTQGLETINLNAMLRLVTPKGLLFTLNISEKGLVLVIYKKWLTWKMGIIILQNLKIIERLLMCSLITLL